MSNALAIAAVTMTLRARLTTAAGSGATVTVAAPDRARVGTAAGTAQVNLYLYQITPNASLRNMDFTGAGVSTGQAGGATAPPLALNLHYLLTAYGDADVETDAHRLMGSAMSTLNDRPVLDLDEIANATAAALGDNDLARQIERVRLTLLPLTTDDYYKIWSGFQSPFRLSVAYEARVVLIDNQQPARGVLPVLTVGPFDRGVDVRAGTGLGLDTVRCFAGSSTAAGRPAELPAARVGDHLLLDGTGLGGGPLAADFTRLPPVGSLPVDRTADPPVLTRPARSTSLGIVVDLTPDNPSGVPWVAGVYNVTLRRDRTPLRPLVSNAVPFRLAPKITAKPERTGTAAARTVAIKVEVVPPVRPEQRVMLLVGDSSADVALKPRSAPVSKLTVPVPSITVPDTKGTAGGRVVRLRVDGVESVPFDPAAGPPNRFDANQTVEVPK